MFQDTYHPATNGVVVSTDLFIDELKRRGHEVLLIAPRHPDYKEPAPEGVHLIPAVSAEFIYPGASLGKFWAGNVGPLLEQFRPDIMHSMTEFTIGHWVASYFREKMHLKRVHTFHTLWTEYFFYLPIPTAIVNRWFQYVAPRCCRKRFDQVLVPSEAMRDTVSSEWGVDVPLDVLPTGLHLDRFKGGVGERFRQRYGIAEDERDLLYLGRLGDEKNVELVVDTMAELRRRGEPRVKLVIAGGGPDAYLRKLHARCDALGLADVIWTGFVRGQDWLDTYAGADIVLFPSTTETQGLVVVESLAAGKPLVSIEAMGPGSVMKGERGCLFATNDARDFADKTQRLLHDDVLYQRKRREAAEVAQSYSIEQRGAELEAIYYRVLGQAPVELVNSVEPVSAEPRRNLPHRKVV
ncbi:MAG: glycosyltransferase [Myxococcota bacterium]